MDGDTPQQTALMRGLYSGIVTALVAGVTAYLAFSSLIDDLAQDMGDISDNEIVGYSVLVGALAGLATLLFRTLVEGHYDADRAKKHAVKPGDVAYVSRTP